MSDSHPQPERRAPRRGLRFYQSAGNWLRITTARIIVQTTMVILFLAFVGATSYLLLDHLPGLRDAVNKFLELDPLIAISTALSSGVVHKTLIWSLIILIPILFLGRFFCGWLCPFGALNQFVGWLFRRPYRPSKPIPGQPAHHPNRYRPSQRLKYYLLIALLVAAALGTLQIGLLDPISLLHRTTTAVLMPLGGVFTTPLMFDWRLYQGAALIGFILLALLAANLIYPRFFCRTLCPLGALLGFTSRFAWWRIDRDPDTCGGCDRCRLHCEGACDPHAQLRQSECFVCFNCIEECPEKALSFRLFPPRERAIVGTDTSRRKLVFAGLAGLTLFPILRKTGRSTRNFASAAIRPPGALEELAFLERCLKCEQCVRVCPTNVIQPATLECGVEGFWTPVMNYRFGHCQYHCTACGHVCPTGAIEPLTIEQKLGLGEHAAAGPVRLGTAHIDFNRCLPHSKNTPCIVCQEVCPTSPKAIWIERASRMDRDGNWIELQLPRIDVDRCIGCGLCEHHCPVVGEMRGVYVTAEGESRSRTQSDPDRNRTVRP